MTDVMRQKYRELTETEKIQMQTVKEHVAIVYSYIDSIGQSRELSLSKTKLEEAVMWATKHITG